MEGWISVGETTCEALTASRNRFLPRHAAHETEGLEELDLHQDRRRNLSLNAAYLVESRRELRR